MFRAHYASLHKRNPKNKSFKTVFKFSTSKTTCVHFNKQRIYYTEPSLHQDSQVILVKDKVKFSSLFFIKNNISSPYTTVKKKCQKALYVFRSVAILTEVQFGAPFSHPSQIKTRLGQYHVWFRQIILKELDPIHHQGLHVALGAFRTTPTPSLYAEAGEGA